MLELTISEVQMLQLLMLTEDDSLLSDERVMVLVMLEK